MPRSGPILAGLAPAALAVLAASVPALGAQAEEPGARKVRFNAPVSATAGKRFPVTLSGTRWLRVRLHIVRRTRPRQPLAEVRPRKGARPAASRTLRRGRLTVRLRAPSRSGRYALTACLRTRTRCTPPTALRVVAGGELPPGIGPPDGADPGTPPPAIPPPGATPPAPAPTPVPEVVPSRRAPNPISVTLTPDTGRRVSGEIGTDGGQLLTSDADGVEYALTIPGGALAGRETVTLTPSAVDGVPFSGGVTGAVTLEPDGLVFLTEADLAITPPAAPAPGRSAGFGADADGGELHLAPLDVDGRTLHVPLRHLGTAGAGTATAQDVRDLLAAAPAGEEELAVGDVAAARALLVRGELDAAGLDTAARAALRRWRLAAVEPALLRSETDEGEFEAATAGFLTWQDALADSGAALPDDLARMTGSHRRAVGFAFDRAFDRCVTLGQYEPMGRLLLLRQLQLTLGYGPPLDDERLVRCGRFRLDRDVSTVFSFPAHTVPGAYDADAGGWSYELHAGGVPILYAPGDAELRGTGAQGASRWRYAAHRRSLAGECDQDILATGIGPPDTGALTLALELPVDLRREPVERPSAVVRVAAQDPIALRYDIVRTGPGLSCPETVHAAFELPGPGAAVRVPVAAGHTGAAFAETVVPIPGAPSASETTRADVRVTLVHTPCPPSTPLASCP